MVGAEADDEPRLKTRKKLLLFIHGLNGGPATGPPEKYWKTFFDVARLDNELTDIYELKFFSYWSVRSGWQRLFFTREGLRTLWPLWRRLTVRDLFRSTSVPESAKLLRTALFQWSKEFVSVDIIAHSQGGLVVRRYIADQVKKGSPHYIGRAVFYDTPNVGSAMGKATELPVFGWLVSQEARDLAPGSDMIGDLLEDEKATGSHQVVPIRYAVVSKRKLGVVDRSSAAGTGHPGDYWVVSDSDHSSIIEPKDKDDPIYFFAKSHLLDPAGRSGDDPAPISEQPRLVRLQFNEIREHDREVSRFAFWAKAVPFCGREVELQELKTFLEDEDRPYFTWKLLCGSGGIGKSRLALELVEWAQNANWRTGFLDTIEGEDYWSRWEPSRPTLLVIDYAGGRAVELGKMLKALAERQWPTRFPVRVLLIERDPKDERLEGVVKAAPRTVGGSVQKQALVLKAMDVQHIFTHVLGKSAEQLRQANEALIKIDRYERRPLYAHLIADALASGKDVRDWDRDALLRDVITRDRTKFWEPAVASLGLQRDERQLAERALALATMVGGLRLSKLSSCSKYLVPEWNPGAHPALFRAMTGKAATKQIPSLEPDLVGEFFVLEVLKALSQCSTTDGGTLATEFILEGWRLAAMACYQFGDRVRTDFPDIDLLRTLVLEPPRDGTKLETWGMLSAGLAHSWVKGEDSKKDAVALYERLEEVVSLHHDANTLQVFQCLAAGHLADGFARAAGNKARIAEDGATRGYDVNALSEAKASHWAVSLSYYGKQRELAQSGAQRELLREYFSLVGADLVGHLRMDPAMDAQAVQVSEELGDLATAYPDDLKVRAHWLLSKISLVEGRSDDQEYLANALTTYDEVKALARNYPNDERLRRAMARGAYRIASNISYEGANWHHVKEISQDLEALSTAYPDDDAVRNMKQRVAHLHPWLRISVWH